MPHIRWIHAYPFRVEKEGQKIVPSILDRFQIWRLAIVDYF